MGSRRINLKIKVDSIETFEREINRFVYEYVLERHEQGLVSITISELVKSEEGLQSIDRIGTYVESDMGHTWAFSFTRNHPEYENKIEPPNMELVISLEFIGGEYPFLISMSPSFHETRPFVKALIIWFEKLWDGILIEEEGGPQKSKQYLISQPIIDSQKQEQIILQRKKSGRPVHPENPIAWEMILKGNGSDNAWKRAFDYWCNEKRITNPNRRDRNAFKKAMKRREAAANNWT